MSTDFELLKQLIDYQGTIYGDLEGIFIPFLRAYFLLTGRPSLYDSIQVRDVEYKKGWDSDCAYVSFSDGNDKSDYVISVWHHEGAYMVFDGRIDDFGTEAEREITNHPVGEGVGKNRCILDFLYCDGLYDSFVEIRNWIIYKGIRDDLGLEGYNFDRMFKGFLAFKKYLAAIGECQEEALMVVGRELGKLTEHENPYQPDPVGNRPHPGRLGTVWALYYPLCTLASRCSKHPDYEIYAEQMMEYE